MQEWIDQNGFEDRNALIRYANALVMKYGGTAGAMACIMYEKTAEAQGKTVKTAEIAELPSYGEVAKAINGTMKETVKKVPSTVGRLTKQVGADTTIKNGIRDGAQFAWVPGGAETCAFCITLASRGWQYMSKKALKNGHAEHVHAGCDCQYAVRFDRSSNVEGYDPDKYKKIYDNMPGKTPEDKINSLRRLLTGDKALTLDQIEFTIDLTNDSKILGQRTPGELKKYLETMGFDVKPLGRGGLKGIPFEDGGGYRINYGGDGYFQYHPEKGSHHGGAYYKIANGVDGIHKFNTNGEPINEDGTIKRSAD